MQRGLESDGSPLRATLWITALLAAVTNCAALASTPLWIFPDSVDYIQLASGIVRNGDFTNELYLVRTPGYPLFLAGAFAAFGTASAIAIQLLQHLMTVGIAVFAAAVAWELTERRAASIAAGALCACSLQLLAYANMALTETPYALTLIACVYCLIRYVRAGRMSMLAGASSLAGVAYLFRPVGLILLAVCWGAVFLSAFGAMGSEYVATRMRISGMIRALVAASAPAALIAAPWMLISASSHKSLQATRCLDYVLYFRAVTMEGFADSTSPALEEIKSTVATARQAGLLPANADHRERGHVMKAYEKVRGDSFAESSAIMGRAGRELMLAHPGALAVGTMKYSLWMMLSPDPVYRFLPGGAAGIDGKRDANSVIYDVGTYSKGAGSWEDVLKDNADLLPLNNDIRGGTGAWRSIVTWFHGAIEQPVSFFGTSRSMYELWGMLSMVGVLPALVSRHRKPWAIVIATLALQIGVSAFLGGPQTRYAAPAKPLMIVTFMSSMIAALQVAKLACRWARRGVFRAQLA